MQYSSEDSFKIQMLQIELEGWDKISSIFQEVFVFLDAVFLSHSSYCSLCISGAIVHIYCSMCGGTLILSFFFFLNLPPSGSCFSSILFKLHSKVCFSCMKKSRGAEAHAYIWLTPFQLYAIVALFWCNFIWFADNMHTVLLTFLMIFS